MGPIIGMGLAISIQDYELLRKSLKNILMAVLGSLIASTIYFLVSPQYEGSSQLLARTSPSIYDVFIALFGGAAGIVSIVCKNKGQVMPGVAIATSLMPPLCTAGYGIATWQGHFFWGALYLFLTNMIFIFVATWIVIKVVGYKKVIYQNEKRAKRIRRIVYSIIFLMLGVSGFLTFQMVKTNIFLSSASEFVLKEMNFPNTQVLNHNEYVKDGKRYIDVTLIGASLPKDSLQLAMMNKLDSAGLGGTVLNIKQGFSLTPSAVNDDNDLNKFYAILQKQLEKKDDEIDSLKSIIKFNGATTDESSRITPEIKVLFPTVRDIAMSRMEVSSVADAEDRRGRDTINMVFVNAPSGLSAEQRKKMSDYIGVRLKQTEVHIAVNPSNFPWPSDK